MTKKNLKIVTINIDYTLAMDSPNFGDAQERNILYGKYVNKIFSITHSPKKMKLKNKKLSEQVEIFPTSSIKPHFFLFDALNIARLIFINHKIDLVLTQDPFITGLVGYILKKRYGCSFLIHFHGDFWSNKYWLREKWYNPILFLLSKFLVKKADGIRVVSSGIKDKLVKKGIDENKIRVIPTPVDLKKFKDYDKKKVEKIKKEYQGRKVIINVGRKDPAKDYKTLYKAIELVYRDYKKLAFLQIGNGDYLPEKIKADENLILKSIDKISQKEVINYYYASDIYISSSCHESLGKVLIEAMAISLPVVATNTTGSKEIIEDEKNGFLVPIGDSQALAKKILFLLNNSDKAEKIGKSGQQMVIKKFNQQKIIKQTIKFWKDLAKRK